MMAQNVYMTCWFFFSDCVEYKNDSCAGEVIIGKAGNQFEQMLPRVPWLVLYEGLWASISSLVGYCAFEQPPRGAVVVLSCLTVQMVACAVD